MDELGTEAAAAMQRTAAVLEPPVPFVVDRPFLLVIQALGNGVPLSWVGSRIRADGCPWGLVGSMSAPPPVRGLGALVLSMDLYGRSISSCG